MNQLVKHVDELRSFDFNNKFLISFDVESLFTNIPLNETFDIAVDHILKHNPKLSIKKPTLRNCFHLPHPRLIFFSMVNFMIKSMG